MGETSNERQGDTRYDPDRNAGPDPTDLDQERADLLEALRAQRSLRLRGYGARATSRPPDQRRSSQLCLGGLIKHVAAVEDSWARFSPRGPGRRGRSDEAAVPDHAQQASACSAERPWRGPWSPTNRSRPGRMSWWPACPLDLSHPLPEAPWFPPGRPSLCPSGLHSYRGRDGSALGSCRHPAGGSGRPEDHGLTLGRKNANPRASGWRQP